MTTEETAILTRIHTEARAAYDGGCRSPEGIASTAALDFMKVHGLGAQFLFDCVDDFSRYGEPDLQTFLALCGIRSRYLHEVMKGAPTPGIVGDCELPPKVEEFDGIAWLPRIIRKAECFLTGCLCPDIMYGCAGDRAFLARHGVSLPDFLTMVVESGGDRARMAAFLRAAKEANRCA